LTNHGMIFSNINNGYFNVISIFYIIKMM